MSIEKPLGLHRLPVSHAHPLDSPRNPFVLGVCGKTLVVLLSVKSLLGLAFRVVLAMTVRLV